MATVATKPMTSWMVSAFGTANQLFVEGLAPHVSANVATEKAIEQLRLGALFVCLIDSESDRVVVFRKGMQVMVVRKESDRNDVLPIRAPIAAA